ncbi:MAG: hypothetical protein EAZ70_06225 [Runella slithyformis]|jgi:hypothetical protein|nr:MAG: hypothetical protein EAY79_10120 [Runella slithyformis]TAG17002.1 MAG: hypothetical protein EAZ38_18025 [Cytophagales bacterium]TAG36137.1 MAG: hypothetical protein EAZ32_17460 [Cytophagia bacterium]TAE96956.1 MAG: hypothetical protein EAZ80_07920 [Runella slithyformis]TAF28129.1 MAG: hypothetical protein EAZ70_06225 [Runella slithyformis]
MNKHAIDSCPRCGLLFECRVNSALKCDCMWLNLSQKELEYVRDYTILSLGSYVCLCVNCLTELQQEYRAQNAAAQAASIASAP